jgi:hypothetical protein
MGSLFDQVAFDPSRPVTTGAQAVLGGAARLARSVVLSIKYLKPEVVEQVTAILNPDNLWAIAVIFAGWVVVSVIGGPIGLAVNGILIVWGIVELYDQLGATWTALSSWFTLGYRARSEQELEESARNFAQLIVSGGLLVLQTLVAHKVFRKAQAQINKRAPTPKWLEADLNAEVERARRRSASPIRSAVQFAAETARPLVTQTGGLAAGNKAGDAARDGYTAVLVGGGVVLTVSVLALIGVTLASGGRK